MAETTPPQTPTLQEIRASHPPLPDSLARWTGYLLNRVGQLNREYFELLIEPMGLGSRDYTILALLEEAEPRPQVEIAERLRLDKNTVVTLLNGLEARGFVERRRDPVDKRAHAVYLLPKAREALAIATPLLEQTNEETLAPLSEEERVLFRQLLLRLV